MRRRFLRALRARPPSDDPPSERRANATSPATFTLDSRATLRAVVLVITAIFAVHIGLEFVARRLLFGGDLPASVGLNTLANLTHPDREQSLPTYLASALITATALVMATIGTSLRRLGERHGGTWIGLSALFVLLAVDEIATVHEQVGGFLRIALQLDGWLRYSWVLPGTALVMLVAAASLPMFMALPRTTALRIGAGVLILLLGAVGLEVVGASLHSAGRSDGPVYAGLVTTEEALEFTGILILLGALLSYLRDHVLAGFPAVRIELRR